MNKEWIEAKKLEHAEAAKIEKEKLIEQINGTDALTEKDKVDLICILDSESCKEYHGFQSAALTKLSGNHSGEENWTVGNRIAYVNFILGLDTNNYRRNLYNSIEGLDRYLDSKPMEFDGDIIITDPCYIMRAEHHGTQPLTDNDWDACNYGSNMECLGIYHYMTSDTLYGDWGCTVYNTDTKEDIGNFCADAGLVSVFLLDEVLKYNPDFDYHKERKWTTTLIPDFKGVVQFVVDHEEGVYAEDSEYWKAGDKWEEYTFHVVGHGFNKKTRKAINFRSAQTSL